MSFLHIEPDRVEAVWVSSAEGPRFAQEMTRFIERIQALGPLARGAVSQPLDRMQIKAEGTQSMALAHDEL